MHQWLKLSIGITAIMCRALHAQNGPPTFEVATIKLAPPITREMAAAGNFHVGMKADQVQLDIGAWPLTELIRTAYQVKSWQISGPDWMSSDKWDILAKLPDGSSRDDIPGMLQALLAERFKLSMHRESRERRVYALEPAKDGVNLKESPPDEDKPLQVATSNDGKSTVVSGGSFGKTRTSMQSDGSMHMESSKMTMAMLADALSYYLDRPIIDFTQLSGGYQIELDFSANDLRYAAMKAGAAFSPDGADAGRAAEIASEPEGASLISSVRRVGLRLELRQALVETIVIDHVEKKPTAN